MAKDPIPVIKGGSMLYSKGRKIKPIPTASEIKAEQKRLDDLAAKAESDKQMERYNKLVAKERAKKLSDNQ